MSFESFETFIDICNRLMISANWETLKLYNYMRRNKKSTL